MDKNAAYLSVGSNLGNRVENCENGIARLAEDGRIFVTERSSFYFTEPLGYTDQPWFVNAVFAIYTELSPEALLRRVKEVEAICGREKGGIRFGPRVLDLDVLLYNDIILDTAELTIPHPRMHERLFVLRPLCEIAPKLAHPGLGVTVSRLLANLSDEGQQCRPVSEMENALELNKKMN